MLPIIVPFQISAYTSNIVIAWVCRKGCVGLPFLVNLFTTAVQMTAERTTLHLAFLRQIGIRAFYNSDDTTDITKRLYEHGTAAGKDTCP